MALYERSSSNNYRNLSVATPQLSSLSTPARHFGPQPDFGLMIASAAPVVDMTRPDCEVRPQTGVDSRRRQDPCCPTWLIRHAADYVAASGRGQLRDAAGGANRVWPLSWLLREGSLQVSSSSSTVRQHRISRNPMFPGFSRKGQDTESLFCHERN